MKKLKKYLKGFTLVELIIVITILAILATIAFVSFQNYVKHARDSNRLTTFTNLNSGFEIFFTKVGNYPQPDSPVSYTGGNTTIQLGIVGENVSKLIGLNTTPKDPLTNQNYIYSLGGNGYYYQIAGEKENTLSSIFTSVYAAGETKLPIVKGNYKMDPSLPSLIPVKTSITSSGIFDPSVCFILDGGNNNFASTSANCIKKKDMSFKNIDSGLIGYWDMETSFNSGGTIWIKDNSGYGNDIFGSGVISKYETGGLINKAIEFNGEGLSQTGYYETEKIIGNIFDESLSMSVIFKKNNSFETMYQKIILIGTGSTKDNFLAGISQGNMNYNFYGLIWPETSNGSNNVFVTTKYPNPNQWNLASISYNKGELKFFLNGNLLGKSNYSMSGAFLEKKNLPLRIGYGYNIEYFKGIIDDVKIYNRALSDQEIAQQAKIAGF